jgi:hypothetical protein
MVTAACSPSDAAALKCTLDLARALRPLGLGFRDGCDDRRGWGVRLGTDWRDDECSSIDVEAKEDVCRKCVATAALRGATLRANQPSEGLRRRQ